ncbi:MAG TPA: NlpC/P60 family protein [Aeromicrobium sp.]|nr:NlpC/P60 family protein [Aeromicrobium sp.]HKY58509.1 NlpC/P60 family protein [Aeromicrobium sp.]
MLVAAGAGVLIATLGGAPAVAKPVNPADVEDAYHRAEISNEQVNMIDERIATTRREIADLNDDIATQDKAYREKRRELGELIAQQHMDAPLGPTVNLMGSKNPTEFLDGLGAVQALNSSQAEQLEEFGKLAEQLKARRGQLKERKSALDADAKHIDQKRKEVEARYQAAKKLFSQMTTAQQAKFNDSDTDLNFEVEAYGRTKQAIDFAIAQLGDAYVYGGTGPSGWDCSGLVMKSFAAAGISLPRVVGPQMSAVRSISMDDLQPGDLVAYGDMSHIGIYLGRGKVIHAPRPGRSVEIHGVGGYSRAGRVG